MIVSASYRTDIPAYYGDWFLARLAAGKVRVASPYGGPAYTVSLAPAHVDGFVFWTRNAAPFLGALEEVRARRFPFVVSHTITGYPRALEPAAPEAERAAAIVRALARRYGPRACVWRYDPIVATETMDAAWHEANFARLARRVRRATDEVVVSWMQPYAKARRRLDRARIPWRDPPADEKRALIARLADVAAGFGLRLTLCAQAELLAPGVAGARCIDAGRLSDTAGRAIPARIRGNRPGCLCAESRDIGAYDTCPMGCAYCYAVSSQAAAARARKVHDPTVEPLAPKGNAIRGRDDAKRRAAAPIPP